MTPDPRQRQDYSDRLIAAAHRVLVDLGQVLKAFEKCVVVVGGWIPDLLLKEAEEKHVGSIDVDLALDVGQLRDGQYAELLKSLLNTRRYRQAKELFRLYAEVDLEDGLPAVRVDVDFLKPPEARTKKNRPELTKGFRPLDASGCRAAFDHPEVVVITGRMIKGASNTVHLRVASIADFLIMKSLALDKRDKPKDAYDICYCLDYFPGGLEKLAVAWKKSGGKDIEEAKEILRGKFESVDAYGPRQVVEFYSTQTPQERERHARRAFELVQAFLKQVG